MSRALEARAWTRRLLVSTRKRRRLAFVGAMSPGVLVIALAPQASQDPAWLGLGLVLLFGALIARRLTGHRVAGLKAQGSPGADMKDQSDER